MSTLDARGNVHGDADGKFQSKGRAKASGSLEAQAPEERGPLDAAIEKIGSTQATANRLRVIAEAMRSASAIKQAYPTAARIIVTDGQESPDEYEWTVGAIDLIDVDGEPVKGADYEVLDEIIHMDISYRDVDDLGMAWEDASDGGEVGRISLDLDDYASRDAEQLLATVQRQFANQADTDVLEKMLQRRTVRARLDQRVSEGD